MVYLRGGSGKGSDLNLITQEDGSPSIFSPAAWGPSPAMY